MIGRECVRVYFVFNKIFLSASGIWPYQNFLLSKIFRYLWMAQQIIIMIAKTIKLYEIKNDIDIVIEAVASYLYNIIITIKFINGVFNERKMKSILKKIEKDWDSITDYSEAQILSYYADFGKFLNIMYINTVYITILLYMCLPLTPIILDWIKPLNESRPKEPLIMAEFFVDQEKYFYSFLVHAYFTALYGIVPLLGADAFYMNCIHHICGMIKILGNRVQNSLEKIKLSNSKSNGEYEEITQCIAQHQSIIEFSDADVFQFDSKFCKDLNETYSTSFLIVMFLSITLMSITGVATVIQLADLKHHFNDVIRFGMFTVAQIFHLFCYNYLGQHLLNSGEKLRERIYDTKWYEASIKTQKLIKFMLLRNLRPSIMQARIFPLCLPNFTNVLLLT